MDLVVEDDSRIGTVYFLMSEDNLRKQIVLPWLSFASDADSMGNDGIFLKASAHPRAFGNFARVYAKYVRDDKLLPVEEAVRKMTSLPVTNLGIAKRGFLRQGYFADVVVFDPDKIGCSRLRRVRNASRLPALPSAMLTGYFPGSWA